MRPRTARINALFDSLGEEGFRVLGIAWRDVALDHPHAVVSDESALVFAGFAAFLDPPKASAGQALHAMAGQRCGGQNRHRRQRARDAPCLHRSWACRSTAC